MLLYLDTTFYLSPKLKISILHGVDILASEPDAMLKTKKWSLEMG